MATVALKLRKKNVPALIIFSRNVHDHMLAAAATFPAPPVTMVLLDTHTTDLEKAESDTVNGNHANFVARDARRLQLESDLNLLGSYVDMIAKGSELVITSAGMDAKKPGTSHKLANLEQPIIRKISCEAKGTLTIGWFPVSRRVNFGVEYTNDLASGAWQNGTYTTDRTVTLDGLNSDTRYWVRVRALGKSDTKSDWSEPATRMVE